jgi:hypothetical protein
MVLQSGGPAEMVSAGSFGIHEVQMSKSSATAAVVAAPTNTFTKVGKIPAYRNSGLFAVGDVRELDSKWSVSNGGGWYVDIYGPNAAKLAGREGGHTKEQLVDGTWRLKVADEPTAGAIRTSAQSLCGTNGWTDLIEIRSANSSSTRVRDASRAHGAGVFGPLLGVKIDDPFLEAEVETDVTGKVVAIHLIPAK